MKFFRTAEFFDNGIHTKKYYFCGVRYLKKIWSDTFRETWILKFRTSHTKCNYDDFEIKHHPISDKSPQLATDGISIVEIGDISGEGKTGRSAIESLKQSDINFDYGVVGDLYNQYVPKYKKQLVFSTANFAKSSAYDIIPLLVWEFESGMTDARPYAFNNIYGIATFSTFCAKYFGKIAPKNLPIYVLPYPIDIDLAKLTPSKTVRKKYGIKPTDFVFFFNFSFFSSYFRKNPEGTLRAFARAFPKHDKNVKLIIKSVGGKKVCGLAERFNTKIKSLGLTDNVIVIDDDLTDYEVYSLINCCNAYISLHRGEGFGLGMMEAMYMAKPVIATNYGGNTDFTTADTALLVDYKMIKPTEVDLAAYKHVKKWPEPSIKTAAAHMRYLYENPRKGLALGKRAQKFVWQNFNREKFNTKIQELIQE